MRGDYCIAAPDTHPDLKRYADVVLPEGLIGDAVQWAVLKGIERQAGLEPLPGTYELGDHPLLWTKGGVDGAAPKDLRIVSYGINATVFRSSISAGEAMGWGSSLDDTHGRQAQLSGFTLDAAGAGPGTEGIYLKRASNASWLRGMRVRNFPGANYRFFRCYGFGAHNWVSGGGGWGVIWDNCNGSEMGGLTVTEAKHGGIRMLYNDGGFDEAGGSMVVTRIGGGRIEFCDGPALDLDRTRSISVGPLYVEGNAPGGSQVVLRASSGYSRSVSFRGVYANGSRGSRDNAPKAKRGFLISGATGTVLDGNPTTQHSEEGILVAASASGTRFGVIESASEPERLTDNGASSRYF